MFAAVITKCVISPLMVCIFDVTKQSFHLSGSNNRLLKGTYDVDPHLIVL